MTHSDNVSASYHRSGEGRKLIPGEKGVSNELMEV